GRLAGAVRPEQAEHAPAGDREGEVAHRDVAGEGLGDSGQPDGAFAQLRDYRAHHDRARAEPRARIPSARCQRRGVGGWVVAPACVLFALLARRAPRLPRGTRLTLWGLGVIFVGNTICYFGALQTIPASTASLIFYTYPVVVTLLSAALGLDRLTLRSVAAAM